MPLTDIQKSGVRRHLGYPIIGLFRTGVGGGTLGAAAAGYRFNEAWGFMEFRLNNLNADEEARVTGMAYGSIILTGLQPQIGDAFSVTFTGAGLAAPQTISYTAPAANPSYDNRINVVNGLASALSQNPTLVAAGFMAAAPYGTGPFSQNAVAIPEVGFTNAAAFSISCSGSGSSAPQVSSPGQMIPPYFVPVTRGATIYGYVPILDQLEALMLGSAQNQDTAQADVWKARLNEMGQRKALYESWVDQLSRFLGIPRNRLGPQYGPRRASSYA